MIEFLMQGVALGALYALIAIPLSLVWMTAHSLDLAVGGYAVFGGLAYAAAGGGGIGLLVALVAGAACGAFSASLFLGLRRLGVVDPMAPGLMSVGVLFALGSLALAFFGVDPSYRPNFDGPVMLGGVPVNPQTFVNLAVIATVTACALLILRYTGLGRAMRASAVSAVDAALVGIRVARLQCGVFVLAGVLGALAGLLMVMTSGLSFEFGLGLTLTSVGAVILLGLRGPVTAVLGGFAIGIVESLAAGYAPSGLGPVLPVAVVFLVLASGAFDFDDRTVRP